MSQRGRPPSGADDNRDKLIEAAKRCFTRMPYHQVTTRLLAEEAGVNAALIRYYFINKEGLYKEMFNAVMGQVHGQLMEALDSNPQVNFHTLFNLYYQVMKRTPAFPILMIKELALGEGQCRDFLLDKLRYDGFPAFERLLGSMKQQGRLKPHLDPRLIRMNCVALMIFPWLTASLAKDMDGFELNDDFLAFLAAHNGEIMATGAFLPEQTNQETEEKQP
ncbi:TetR/AcrR family transcriptional regulator [Aliiglaciecola sp. CAU 1673]|uniref:TetR/AcrR family transcriptional regulator n=1 Tax=Aliiglaciecola sp. CAU 1673 TaxID=3032595 RepID=UPI0023D9A619|nr:TetR/AcrR family transcriptional regulator [Aliiglaciecola sp. CAU 1673]MDF2178164.1 TetR/AcrR family transcriptional regulator [Aliiglaciecola sp. CAU 1673]